MSFIIKRSILVEYIPENEETDIIIPHGVTKIGMKFELSPFSNFSSVTSVIIPDSVTEIEDYAFDGCASLTSVSIPKSVTTIGKRAFSGCTSLESVIIENPNTQIFRNAFFDCPNLKIIHASAEQHAIIDLCNQGFEISVNMNRNYMLSKYCGNEEELVIPDCVTEIAAGVFQNNSSLRSVVIPPSVTNIYKYAFADCISLQSVTIENPDCNIHITAFKNCNPATVNASQKCKTQLSFYKTICDMCEKQHISFDFDKDTVTGCIYDPEEIVFPEGVTKIEGLAFSKTVNLKKLTLPNTIKELGGALFENNPQHIKIYYNGTLDNWKKVRLIDEYIYSYRTEHGMIDVFYPTFYRTDETAICEVICIEDGKTIIYQGLKSSEMFGDRC